MFLTTMYQGTLGDLNSAVRLIQTLNPEQFEVTLLISREDPDKDIIPDDFIFPCETIESTDSWQSILTKHTELLKPPSIVCTYPTIMNTLAYLLSHEIETGTPLQKVFITEYGISPITVCNQIDEITQTMNDVLSGERMPLYRNDFRMAGVPFKVELDPIISKLQETKARINKGNSSPWIATGLNVKDLGTVDVEHWHEVGVMLLSEDEKASARPTTAITRQSDDIALFVGYCYNPKARECRRDPYYSVDGVCGFVRICLEVLFHEKSPHDSKNVDMVVRVTDKDEAAITRLFIEKGYGRVVLHTKTEEKILHNNTADSELPVAHLWSVGALPKQEFLGLLQAADAPVMVTGDGSASDAWSLGLLYVYEVMEWKRGVLSGLAHFINAMDIDETERALLYDYLITRTKHADSDSPYITVDQAKHIADLIHDPRLKPAYDRLCAAIARDRNFAHYFQHKIVEVAKHYGYELTTSARTDTSCHDESKEEAPTHAGGDFGRSSRRPAAAVRSDGGAGGGGGDGSGDALVRRGLFSHFDSTSLPPGSGIACLFEEGLYVFDDDDTGSTP